MTTEMASSQSEFKAKLQKISDRAVDSWCSLVKELGLSEGDADEWKELYQFQVQDLHDQLIKEVYEKRNGVIKSIEGLLAQAQVLCLELEVPMPNFGSQNLGLYQEQIEIVGHVRRMQEMWDKRMVEVNVLLTEQKDLCTALQRRPIEISMSSLPSKDDFENLQQYIKELEQEKFDRTEKFINLKCECIEYAQKVNYSSKKSFERSILKGNDNSFAISISNLDQLEKFHNKLSICYKKILQEINELWVELNDLWNFLEEDRRFCKSFTQKHEKVTYDTLLALKKEICRCDEIKRDNMQKVIEKCRKYITNLWDKCFYGETERNEFAKHFHDELYTVDLLELHELQLNRLNTFYEQNRNLISLVKSRNDLWEKMLQFEQDVSNPNRFNNRGGQLLQEEKERKTFLKKLPDIEAKIKELAANFESRCGKKFLYFGRSIEEIIVESHAGHEQDKKLKLSARKQERALTPTGSHIRLTPNSSSQNSSNRKLRIPGTNLSPSTLGASSKLTAPLFPRRAQTSTKKNRAGTKDVFKIRLNNKTICKSKITFSAQKNKNAEKYKRISAMFKKHGGSTWLEYDEFQTRVAARSTIFAGDSSPMAFPLPITPK